MDNHLLKVLIVDDEENIRSLVKMCINWHEIGMVIAGEFPSCREALDALENINPDIIITDICMPFMDGLEFSSIVAERFPHVKIIVLSAYEEFEYAKKGIKIGVADFLQKPINRGDLKKALLNLRKKIEAEKLSKNEYTKLKERLKENFPYLKEKFLNDLLIRSYSIDEIKDKLIYFSLDSLLRHVQVALIEPSLFDTGLDGSEEESALLDLACVEVVKQYFKGDAGVNVFIDNSRRIVVLNSDPAIDIIHCCEQLKALVINRLKCYVCIGVGNEYKDFKNLRKSYKEAYDALNYKVVYGKNQIVCFNDVRVSNQSSDIKKDEINEIGFSIKAGLDKRATEVIERIFDDLYLDRNNNIEQIRMLSVIIVTTILNAITELGLNFEDIFNSETLPYNHVLKIGTIPEMKEYLRRLVLFVNHSIKKVRKKKTNKLFNDLMYYIHNNISDPRLSLSRVANEFHLNSSYLSRIFKQEVGFTFVEYLTKIRIEKALNLFKETDLRAYEVGERIGIPDPNYFGKCFKKYTGLSVNDYRKNKS